MESKVAFQSLSRAIGSKGCVALLELKNIDNPHTTSPETQNPNVLQPLSKPHLLLLMPSASFRMPLQHCLLHPTPGALNPKP